MLFCKGVNDIWRDICRFIIYGDYFVLFSGICLMNNFCQDAVNVVLFILYRYDHTDERLGVGTIRLFQKEAKKEEKDSQKVESNDCIEKSDEQDFTLDAGEQ